MSGQWYSSGTAAVPADSAVIVGSLTAWNAIAKSGDGILFGNDPMMYEVSVVTDNTHITLRTPYSGTLNGAVAYRLIPLSPLWTMATELASQLRALLSSQTEILFGVGPPYASLG